MNPAVPGLEWTDPAVLGYPALFGGVLLGSVVPVVPTGAVVGAAAAVAVATGELSLPMVLLLSTVAALIGDVITFAVARAGRGALMRWVARGQSPQRLEAARAQFVRRGGVLVVIGRVVPAGRIPVLLAAGGLGYPWRRLLPAAVVGCVVWALAYIALGVLSGGLFDDPVLAPLLAAVLVLVVAGVVALGSQWWHHHRATGPDESTGPTGPDESTGPTGPDESTGPTGPDESTGPTAHGTGRRR